MNVGIETHVTESLSAEFRIQKIFSASCNKVKGLREDIFIGVIKLGEARH